jgi:hypothetical protein
MCESGFAAGEALGARAIEIVKEFLELGAIH